MTCFTLINILAHSCSLQLISIWAGAGVSTWVIDAQILTHVAGEGTLINVCTSDRVCCQLIALITLAYEGAQEIVALMLTGIINLTLINIHTAVVVAGQLVASVTLTVVGANSVDTSVHAVVGYETLIPIHTPVPYLLVASLALTAEGASGVIAGLVCAAGVGSSCAFINVSAEVLLIQGEARIAAHSAWTWRNSAGSWGNGDAGGVWLSRHTGFITFTNKNLCILRKAKVSAKVVDALHASFAGIRQNGTFINIFALLSDGVIFITIGARICRLLGFLRGNTGENCNYHNESMHCDSRLFFCPV